VDVTSNARVDSPDITGLNLVCVSTKVVPHHIHAARAFGRHPRPHHRSRTRRVFTGPPVHADIGCENVDFDTVDCDLPAGRPCNLLVLGGTPGPRPRRSRAATDITPTIANSPS